MFCPKCGEQLEDGSQFCGVCGTQIKSRPKPNTVESQPAQKPLNAQNTVRGQAHAGKPKNNPNKKMIIGIVAGACALVAIIVVLIVVLLGNRTTSVSVNITIPEYSDNNSTRIPVNVKLNDEENLQFINSFGEGLQLKDGDYEISFPSSPLCESGVFYDAPKTKAKLNIKGGNGEVEGNKNFEFKKTDMEKLTDSTIDSALDYAKKDEKNADNAEKYAENTKKARDKAVTDGEAKRQAEELAKKKALSETQFVSGDYISKDGRFILTLDLDNLKYTVKENGNVVDTGRFLNNTDGLKYIKEEAIVPDEQYGTELLVMVSDNKVINSYGYFHMTLNRDIVKSLPHGAILFERKHNSSESPAA